MDLTALLIGLAWAALAAVFGLGWARGGNGHWRWKSGDIHPNAPIFGLLAFACSCSTILFLILTFGGQGGNPSGRFLNRTLGEIPTILALTAVAIIRKPWGK